jgi:hypothetical protein
MTITQNIFLYKTKVSHKHVVVIYHQDAPLPKVQKGLDGYNVPLVWTSHRTTYEPLALSVRLPQTRVFN